MAGSVNKTILISNLGHDREIRKTQPGSKSANLTIATSEHRTNKSTGEKCKRTEWHRASIWNETHISFTERYLRKGRVYVEGQLQTRKWTDQQGLERYTTEIVIKPYGGNLVLIDSQRDGGNPPPAQPRHTTQRTQPNHTADRSMSDVSANQTPLDEDVHF